jgi:hypothetical protein
MTALTYIAIGILIIGWTCLFFRALSDRSEQNYRVKQSSDTATEDQIQNPEVNSTHI